MYVTMSIELGCERNVGPIPTEISITIDGKDHLLNEWDEMNMTRRLSPSHKSIFDYKLKVFGEESKNKLSPDSKCIFNYVKWENEDDKALLKTINYVRVLEDEITITCGVDKKLKGYENQNPTEAEQLLWKYAGFYPITKTKTELAGITTEHDFIVYALMKNKNDNLSEYPKEIIIEDEMIDYDQTITFDATAGTMNVSGFVDSNLLNLILMRAKELGFNTKEADKYMLIEVNGGTIKTALFETEVDSTEEMKRRFLKRKKEANSRNIECMSAIGHNYAKVFRDNTCLFSWQIVRV